MGNIIYLTIVAMLLQEKSILKWIGLITLNNITTLQVTADRALC